MGINLTRLFFQALFFICAAFALLCFFKGKFKKTVLHSIGEGLRYICLQCFLNLVFFAVYIMYIKNGRSPSGSDVGVSLLPFSAAVFWAAFRFSALSADVKTLLYPALYSALLLVGFFVSGSGVKFLGYILLNPIYGFIGSGLVQGKLRPLAAVSALLPFACAALGRGIALKGIDRKNKK